MCNGSSVPGNNTSFKGNNGNSSAISFLLREISTPTGGMDTQNISHYDIQCGLARQFTSLPFMFQQIYTRLACITTPQTVWPTFAPLGEQCNGCRSQKKQFP